jgi:hypothetical protein
MGGGGHIGGVRRAAEPEGDSPEARRRSLDFESGARFGTRLGSTRRGERDELTQGLREAALAAPAARTVRGRRC